MSDSRHNLRGRRSVAVRPRTGPYYWVPVPNKQADVTWRLMEFFDRDDAEGGQIMHTQVWLDVLDYLALKWNRDAKILNREIGECVYGLPRGRVTRMSSGQHGIAQGNDNPVADWEARIKRVYNLTAVTTKVYFDEHERMMPTHPEAIQKSLRRNLALALSDKVASFDDDGD